MGTERFESLFWNNLETCNSDIRYCSVVGGRLREIYRNSLRGNVESLLPDDPESLYCSVSVQLGFGNKHPWLFAGTYAAPRRIWRYFSRSYRTRLLYCVIGESFAAKKNSFFLLLLFDAPSFFLFFFLHSYSFFPRSRYRTRRIAHCNFRRTIAWRRRVSKRRDLEIVVQQIKRTNSIPSIRRRRFLSSDIKLLHTRVYTYNIVGQIVCSKLDSDLIRVYTFIFRNNQLRQTVTFPPSCTGAFFTNSRRKRDYDVSLFERNTFGIERTCAPPPNENNAWNPKTVRRDFRFFFL